MQWVVFTGQEDCCQSLIIFLSVFTKIVNASLRCGKVPDCLKPAVTLSGLKKPSLETNKISSFCPISNLKFAAKAIEKVAVL